MTMSTSNPGGATARRTRPASKSTAVLLIKSGKPATASSVEIAVGPKTLKILARQPSWMRALMKTFGTALEKSRAIGRAVQFVVHVGPAGQSKITLVTAHTDAPEPKPAPPTGQLENALDAARSRGHLRVAEILSGPDMLNANQFAELIGTSRVTVNARRQNQQILGLEGAKRGYRFPEWQIGQDGKPFAALPELFDRLGRSPWAVYRFLVQHHPELAGMTGREALQQGHTTEAIAVAESVARDFS